MEPELRDTRQFLAFCIGCEEYAIEILRTREIIEYRSTTRVPGTPLHVRGVINLRGAVVPVVDLRLKFAREETAALRRRCIVIVELRRGDELAVIGLIADSVSEVIEVDPRNIAAAPEFGTGMARELLAGIAQTARGLCLILDVDRALASDFGPLAEATAMREVERAGAAAPA